MWGPILEKAWAKMKANYVNSDYGYVSNGIRSLTGSPVFHYSTLFFQKDEDINNFFQELKKWNDKNYIIGASTLG